jgi:hypothetical protein
MWRAPVADYIHKMRMEPMLKRRKAKIEKEQEEALVGPDLTQCVLNDLNGSGSDVSSDPPPGKDKEKINVKTQAKTQTKTKGPNNKLCYLAYAAPKTAETEEPANEPNTRVCLI